MGTWKTRGLRGSTLEDLINRTNDSYREKGLALIQKVPTPITPISIDKESRHITLAYFDPEKYRRLHRRGARAFPSALTPRSARHPPFPSRTFTRTRLPL